MKVQTKLAALLCATLMLNGCESYYDKIVTLSGNVEGECRSASYCTFSAQDGSVYRIWNTESGFRVYGDNVCLAVGIRGTNVYPMHFVPKMLCDTVEKK